MILVLLMSNCTDVIVHKVLYFFFVYCNDVLMQYCKVLGYNRTLLLAKMLYALYNALMLLCICRTFSIGTDVTMPMFLH